MVNSLLLIITILLFIPINTEIPHKRRRQIAEFDLPTEEKLGEKLEAQLGRSYEFLGHSMFLSCYLH
jgi:hypothetical protein